MHVDSLNPKTLCPGHFVNSQCNYGHAPEIRTPLSNQDMEMRSYVLVTLLVAVDWKKRLPVMMLIMMSNPMIFMIS